MRWSEISHIAGGTGGVFRIEAVIATGVARSTLHDAIVGAGCWRPFRGVAAMPGVADTFEARLHAVALASQGMLAFTRWTAAHLHGVRTDEQPERIQVVVANGCSGPDAPWLQVLRSRTLTERDIRRRRDVPTVTPERMLADLAPVTDLATLRGMTIDTVQRRLTTPERVERRALAAGTFAGRSRLRRVCQELAADRCDSVFERGVGDGLAARGILVDHQVEVDAAGRRLHIDLGIPEIEFGIECKGAVAHSTRQQRHVDARRENRLALAGRWRILTIDWDRYTRDFDGFAAEVCDAIALCCDERGIDPARYVTSHLVQPRLDFTP